MSRLLCKFGVHRWDGCKCVACSMMRDVEHDWDGCTCKRCKATREHEWNGCTCNHCKATREHEWDGCTCRRCKATREHEWSGCTCNHCKATREHEWDGCTCKRCSAREHEWDGCTCKRCKATRGHHWDGHTCRWCGAARPTVSKDEQAAVQRLVQKWKSGSNALQSQAACDDLRKFPNPVAVSKVFAATLIKGDWASEFMAGSWPQDFAMLLGESGDVRVLEDLWLLYWVFESNPKWMNWSNYFAVAILRTKGGWDSLRGAFVGGIGEERFILNALTSSASWEADEVADYHVRLSDDEKRRAIAAILASEKKGHRLCMCLGRVGIAALDPLLNIYRTAYTAEAATAICAMPGAADFLISSLSTEKIEEIIAQRYGYSDSWNENLMRLMARLRSPRCIEWLNKEASNIQKIMNWSPEVKSQRLALIKSLLGDRAET